MSVYSDFPAEWGSVANPTPPTTPVKHSYSGSQTGGIGSVTVVFGGFKISRRGIGATWQSGGDTLSIAGPIWDLQRVDLATGLGVSVFQQSSPWGGTDPDPTPLAGSKLGSDGEIFVPTDPGYAYILYSAFSSQHNPGTYYAGNLSESVGGGSGSGAKSGSEIWFLPLPPPIPGPILTLENKTGHFHATGPVQLEFNIFDNPETSNANSAIITINGTVSNFLPTEFPVIETVSGFGLHTVKFEGTSDDGDKSVIDYSFSIGTNDWSPNLLTPIKTIRHIGEDVGEVATHNPFGVINLYSKNSVITQRTFQDLFGSGHAIYGNANSTVTFSTAFAGEQIDTQNTFNKFAASSDTLPNTYIKFDDVMNFPARNDLQYFAQAPGIAVDHEIGLFIACVNTFNVRDECDIPPPVELNLNLRSSPNANGDYEFTAAGLTAEAQVTPNGHPHHQQYYHVYYPDTDTHTYSRIDDNLLTAISLNPSADDTKLVLDLFNSCGTKVSKTFDIEFISGGGSIGPIGGGGSASGSAVTIVESATTGVKPANHSLIVVR